MKNPTSPLKRPILFLLTLLCAAIAGAQIVHAATFPIADGDVAALITAINTSNTNTDDDTIELATNGTYTLTVVNNFTAGLGDNGLPIIAFDTGHELVIRGNGATLQRSTAVGTPGFRIFYIGGGTDVTIDGLTIMNGSPGGGIYNAQATLTVTNSTISGNFGQNGGGIFNDGRSGGSATLTVTNSTISGNSAAVGGGGILNAGTFGSATLTVTNSTISGNFSGFGIGDGIYNNSGTTSGSTLTISNTILKAGGPNISNDSASIIYSLGYNLSSDAAGGDATTGPDGFLNATGDIRNTDPSLGPLQDNGGPTFTHELLAGSPAIDKGKNFSTATTDQRSTGFARTVDLGGTPPQGGDHTDIGAFEVQAAPSQYAASIQQPVDADGSSVFTVRRGVVPVKFTLTLNGVATCDLPAATIVVTRTAGGTPGPVDEAVYTGSADNGSNFRISNCQYIYNLSASALGLGTYQVDIMINNQVVGSGMFRLK